MTFSPPRELPPEDREAVLRIAGSVGQRIYSVVRKILNETEAAAPWALLYYPPEERETFVELGFVLVGMVQAIPGQIEQLVADLSSGPDAADAETLDSIQFFFTGIHTMASPELEKLQTRLTRLASPDGETFYTQEEKDYLCEVSADLKGKYLSSIMGAAASLIAEGKWDGVEIEPILFPEKAEEFERNRHLVKTLREVVDHTRRLPEEVPLVDLVEHWREGRRVDQYALTPLYSFLGVLGKLMKESSRRALYSGDYHQIRKRERQVSQKVNELNMLHNATWTGVGLTPGQEPYELMVQRACEIAALLNIEMLKSILGDPAVQTLRQVVVTASDRLLATYEPRPGLLPSWWRELLPILQDDDLRTFFDLLLGSVLKRASLALDAKRAMQAEVRAAEAKATAEGKAVEQASVAKSEPAPASAAVTQSDPAASVELVDPALLAGGQPMAVDPTAVEVAPQELAAEDLFIPIDFEAVGGLDPMENSVAPPAGARPEAATDTIGQQPLDPPPDSIANNAKPSKDTGFDHFELNHTELDPTAPPALTEPATSEIGGLDFLDFDMPEVDFKASDPLRGGDPQADEREGIDDRNRIEALGRLRMCLRELTASHNAQRRQFDFLFSLLTKKKFIPPTMVQSIYPFLDDVCETLVPHLDKAVTFGDIAQIESDELVQVCRNLRSENFDPQQLRKDVPIWMQRIVDLLEGFEQRIETGIEGGSPSETAPSFFGSQTGSFLT